MADTPQEGDDDGRPTVDRDAESGRAPQSVEEVLVSTTMAVVSQIDERWFLYPAYVLTLTAGALAVRFAAQTPEWSAGPAVLAWSLLFIWHWLYGVGFRYRRPALKYVSLAVAAVFGGLLTAFSLDRAVPQLAATEGGVAMRGVAVELLWCAGATGIGVALVVAHAFLFSRARKS